MNVKAILKSVNEIKLMYLLLLIGLFQQPYLNAQTKQKDSTANCCYNKIPNLTESVKTKIKDLQKTHFTEMDVLRTKKRSSATVSEKDEISKQMTEKCSKHREEVRSLLDESQKKYFDKNYGANGKYCCGKNKDCPGRGYGKGKGNGNGNKWRHGRQN